MQMPKSRFALFFGNRGFFPASLVAGAREELPRVLKQMGHDSLMMAADATPHGAVETAREGQKYANWLRENRGKFDGVIVSLPNFGDETGAVAALQEAGVPIFIQACPDEADKMGPATRRDSFCGKISIMDVFRQYGVKFTVAKPHTVGFASSRFQENIAFFDGVCRAANGLRGMVVGAIGARTTPFKTVRVDETAMQRHGITMETVDLAEVISRVRALADGDAACKAKAQALRQATTWEGVPEASLTTLAKLGVVLDQLAEEYAMDAMAVRCWTELQSQLGVSPCILMGLLNDAGRPTACEVDVANAVVMHGLQLAAGSPAGLLDWNNNYGDEDDKCILFHCGPMPPSLMTGPGRISDHAILCNAVGQGCSYGCNTGRIKPTSFTFGSMLTDAGRLRFYLGEGRFTIDPISDDFFGCAGVAEIPQLQDVLLHVGKYGHRHHVSVAAGRCAMALHEALTNYIGADVALPQRELAEN